MIPMEFLKVALFQYANLELLIWQILIQSHTSNFIIVYISCCSFTNVLLLNSNDICECCSCAFLKHEVSYISISHTMLYLQRHKKSIITVIHLMNLCLIDFNDICNSCSFSICKLWHCSYLFFK